MATNAAKKPPPKKRKANGYKMPGRIPKGEIMSDISNKSWVINVSIGLGGFGEIYSASPKNDKSKNNYVIKVEPSENGPLFCEKTVYLKIGKKEDIEEFMKLRKLTSLGMPRFFGCGTHVYNGTKYRFLVLERYGKDLWSLFVEKGRVFPSATVFKIGIQVLDVLEYIHSKTYVHADIKGANLLLGLSKGTENQVYLVDFGLSARYATEFKPNPKKAHNGTLEYISRDAHVGVMTRRGDIEILGYIMLQWISSSLPWERLTNPNEVKLQKDEKLKDCNKFIKSCIQDASSAEIVSKYFHHLCNKEPLDEPGYIALRRILKGGAGDATNKLQFSPTKSSPKPSLKVASCKIHGDTFTESHSVASDEPVCKRTRAKLPKCNNDKDVSDEGKNDTDEDEDEDDEDLYIQATPPGKEKGKIKRSWKDAPTVVSCAALQKKNNGNAQKHVRK